MQAWWNSGPYFDTSVYLPGSPNRGTDAALTPTWVQGAQRLGWGLIPTWFGLQSSCIIGQPNVTQYFGVNGADPSTQGAEEADQAIAAAQRLGLATTIVYHDIENYTVNSSCSPVVEAFVDGWDTEMGLQGYQAGVYGNPLPAANDFSKASTIPNDVWIAKTPTAPNPPSVTTWGLTPLCDPYSSNPCNTLWPSHQRMHQFLIDQASVAFGGFA
jgi:hypothetical protein